MARAVTLLYSVVRQTYSQCDAALCVACSFASLFLSNRKSKMWPKQAGSICLWRAVTVLSVGI